MESDRFIVLRSGDLRLSLCVPDSSGGYYRGTRFDHAGVFRRIEYKGRVFADEWFPKYDPYRHDCLTGPVEEFSQNGYDETLPGGLFLKPGVGLLRREDDSPYDWFHLYEIVDEGKRSLETDGVSAVFGQKLSGDGFAYEYSKTVSAEPEDGAFSIRHRLLNTGRRAISGHVYNHNFFTLAGSRVGAATKVDFPFSPSGHWRSEYDSVALSEGGIRFSRDLRQGETVYMGDLHSENMDTDYSFRLFNEANALGFNVLSDAPMSHAVFWAISRVACVEPHTPLAILPGHSATWTIFYRLFA